MPEVSFTFLFVILVNGIFLGSLYALAGAGLSIPYGVSSIINLSYGDFIMLGAYVSFFATVIFKINPILSMPLTLSALGLFATLIYYTGLHKVLEKLTPEERGYATLTLTFALSMTLPNLVAWLYTPNYRSYEYMTWSLDFFGVKITMIKLLTILISFSLLGALRLILKRTLFGLRMRCTLEDDVAAQLVGVNIRKIHFSSFIIGSMIAGVCGCLFTLHFYLHPYMGVEYTMIAFVVAILGGLGSLLGAMIGGILIGFLEAIFTCITSPLMRIAIVYLALIVILWIKPRGLFRGV